MKKNSLEPHLNIGFPPVDHSDEQGFLCYGGKLDPDHILSAYSQGIFPWPRSDIDFPLWFAPPSRGIIDFKDFKVSTSFKKFLKKSCYQISFNQAFELVMNCCQQAHVDEGVWITSEMIKGYSELHRLGFAYSVECWDQKQELVGGLYGVILGNFISAESMFYKQANASKLALWSLVNELQQVGCSWLDTQMITPVVETFGGKYIDRQEFMDRLRQCDLHAQLKFK